MTGRSAIEPGVDIKDRLSSIYAVRQRVAEAALGHVLELAAKVARIFFFIRTASLR